MTYDEMTIDELNDAFAALLANEVQSPITLIAGALVTRRQLRDFYLDLAEALDADGLVVVPEKLTDDMMYVAWSELDLDLLSDFSIISMWASVTAAAPLMGGE